MKLETLTVSHFRCWTYESFSFTSNLNYVTGSNGSGKTSLLEAIHYLSSGRSFRTNRDKTCLQWETDSFSVNGAFTGNDEEDVSISFSYSGTKDSETGRKKVAKYNGQLVEKLSELQKYFISVVFTPDDLGILKDGPSRRREFLDRILVVLEGDYLANLKNYRKAKDQRNSLLKRPSPDSLLLEQYETKLASYGKEIIRSRSNLLPRIENYFTESVARLMDFEEHEVKLRYSADTPPERLETILDDNRPTDLERGYTTRGPHRDDWMVELDGKPVDRFCSQGELRTLLLALKLSVNSVIINSTCHSPIFLLDDLESELDKTRKNRVLDMLHESPSQGIITGTGDFKSSQFGESSDQIFTIEAG